MSAPRSDEPSFESLGQRPAFQYWDDAINVWRWLWHDQILRWSGIWQRVVTNQESPQQWIEDVWQLWMGWIQAMGGASAFPLEWSLRRAMSVPNLVFMIDDVAETTPPQSALTSITAEGLMVGATDLKRVGGHGTVSSAHVDVTLLDRGNRVQVTLVDLARALAGDGNRRTPGLYLGLAYAYERPNMRPLAAIWLHVQGPGQPGETVAAP